MSATTKILIRTTYSGFCPVCKSNVSMPVGTRRCPEGHWLYWTRIAENDFDVVPGKPVKFPAAGRVHFRDETHLSTRAEPGNKKSKKGTDLRFRQQVVVTEEKDGFYHLEVLSIDAGWIEHRFIVLSYDVASSKMKAFTPMKATVTRDGGATLWSDEKLTKRVKVLQHKTVVTIIGEKGNSYQVHGGWLNKSVVTLTTGKK